MPTDASLTFAAPQKTAPRPALEKVGLWLAPAEIFLIVLSVLTGALAAVLAFAFDQQVAWAAFLISFAPAIGLIGLGAYIRVKKQMHRAGLAAIGAGIYIGFSGVIAILIYLRFPISTPLIDTDLMRIDQWLVGYDWVGFVGFIAQYPTLGKILGWVYNTSLGQLFVVIFVLGLTGRTVQLHRVLVAGIVSLLFAVAFWWAWPSIGPSAYFTLPTSIEQALGLVHGHAEGGQLLRMTQEGNALIAPGMIMGTIAFPSYHTVMVFLAICFVRGTMIFWPMVLLNIGMLPAILSHGGHHFSDLLGGFAVFVLAWLFARWIVPSNAKDQAAEANA
ncbi:phosphatase PAP2 family protein [Sulfitobacter mediterraneus]|uniref:phosphatase PAP2 family protein n=1 Tax=Sulfitobacter mediterraneus TaxID=83219 RepID=UPI00193303DD|nr:phosphatase PAP2 family protein [Sulfitobacter mediterraneus]MBM1633343.1 phosphatase PAP2 family protein [Sulfitobacter mediterraneus]MBM1640523.1 phosphatase PAP2 family protein [Sulfitobacter mediterraneus]MBM1645208.1 phosphatase PAP2 family protein [Sulfitobacter mediterraneus]MBM1648643.1 phosphatase PAP2 family protein [Sulfitobacter mediterraneus]MBM1652664.1 phosphatase PAP2 family protein [Sulfitobacter mediterraneus]